MFDAPPPFWALASIFVLNVSAWLVFTWVWATTNRTPPFIRVVVIVNGIAAGFNGVIIAHRLMLGY